METRPPGATGELGWPPGGPLSSVDILGTFQSCEHGQAPERQQGILVHLVRCDMPWEGS